MNDEELREFRANRSEKTLHIIVLIYTFELYGMAYFSDDGLQAGLTPKGRELAIVLFDEEEYRNYAIEKVDLARQSNSKVDYVH